MGSQIKKPVDISQEDWESVDVPEATDAEFATARPFKDVFPAQYKAWKRMGRPPVAAPKIHIGFRLAADVVGAIRASGRGYNARVEKVLRDALAKGELVSGSPAQEAATITTLLRGAHATKQSQRADGENFMNAFEGRGHEPELAVFPHKCILIDVNKTHITMDLIDATRYAWRLSAERAKMADYILATVQDIVIGVFVADEWLPAVPDNFPGFPQTNVDRYGFRGHEASDDVKELYLGKRVPAQRKGAQNPIHYVGPWPRRSRRW